ncbi:MAG: hypothetical protein ACI9F9_002225 [Candidatus Paceibacteria bacterium]|jgi:hypothetical protein
MGFGANRSEYFLVKHFAPDSLRLFDRHDHPFMFQKLNLFPMRLSVALLLGGTGMTGCNTVEFYEMERIGDSVMSLDDGEMEAHFYHKVFYSMEGSAGGIGTSAGGGCGCY